jgi:hypothetical protein
LQGLHYQRRFSGDILYKNNANFRIHAINYLRYTSRKNAACQKSGNWQ